MGTIAYICIQDFHIDRGKITASVRFGIVVGWGGGGGGGGDNNYWQGR